jgi:DNA polymerase-1
MRYKYVTESRDLSGIAAKLGSESKVGLDIETTDLCPYKGKIRLLTLAMGEKIYVIDLFRADVRPLVQALNGPHETIGQNLKFDQKFLLHHLGVELAKPFDLFRASVLIHNGKRLKHDLFTIRQRECGKAPGPDLGGSNWSLSELQRDQLDYAAEDVADLVACQHSLGSQLERWDLSRVFSIEMGAILPEAATELCGLKLNAEKWLDLAKSNQTRSTQLEQELYELMPSIQPSLPGVQVGFNLNSPQQVLESLGFLGLQVAATDHDTLVETVEELRETDADPRTIAALDKFVAFRDVSKKLTAFGTEFLEYVSPSTRRVLSDYYPLTEAGRYASSKPNIQQIPRDKQYRGCFEAEEGNKLVLSDYCQIEAVVAAELTQDPVLKEIFQKDQDIHKRTAAEILGVPFDQVTKQQRQIGKSLVYGLLFGLGEQKLIRKSRIDYGVSMTPAQAKQWKRGYYRTYKGIHKWHKETQAKIDSGATICRTLSGRLRYMQPKAYNEWKNTPVQGTAADGLKTSLRLVYDKLRKYNGAVRIAAHAHDEIILEAKEEYAKEAKNDLEEAMVAGMQSLLPSVPVRVDSRICDSWADK